jgi:hypothetical protein
MDASIDLPPAMTPVEVRERLVETLELDLVGPWREHELENEALPRRVRPSNWYLTGFLIPVDAPEEQAADADGDDDFDDVPESEGPGEESTDDRVAAKKAYFPSSMGLSTLIAKTATSLTIRVYWGDYALGELFPEASAEDETEPKAIPVWQRTPREHVLQFTLGTGPGVLVTHPLPDTGGLELHTLERDIPAGAAGAGIPAGTRSLSVFLVNRRTHDPEQPDHAYVFQPELQVSCEAPFVPRPDLRGANADEWDELVADLHYADMPEYATGHGIAADWEILDGDCRVLRTRWIPGAEVEKTVTAAIPDVELRMSVLGALADGSAAHEALTPLVTRYREWIVAHERTASALSGQRRATADELLRVAGLAADRIECGIDVLAVNEDALDAFRVANRSVATALDRRLKSEKEPTWRAFQLAFILINLPGIADPLDAHRETVDLLFFPTGGGKTEAYLGLSAFTMVLRQRDHALHAAAAHARPARPRSGASLRARTRAPASSRALRHLAV